MHLPATPERGDPIGCWQRTSRISHLGAFDLQGVAALGDVDELTKVGGLDRVSLQLYEEIRQQMQEPLSGHCIMGGMERP